MRICLMLCLATAAWAQPKIIDAHVHHNGDPAFLTKLLDKLKEIDGAAFLLTPPKDMDQVTEAMRKNPGRIVGFGSIELDDPKALEQIDRFHQAGFRGLGELTRPQADFHDRRYWPIYERAEKYGMILLFHTGIVMRSQPDKPGDVSSDRMRPSTLDLIARKYPKLTIIGAHLGNPDYAWAAEIARWNPNLYFDLSGSTLIKKQNDYPFFKSLFWWSDVSSPHTPKSGPSAFEKVIFASDVFGGELEELDRSLERYHKMLDQCGVSKAAQDNIFGGTMTKILAGKH